MSNDRIKAGRVIYNNLKLALESWGDATIQVTNLDSTPIRVAIISDRFQDKSLKDRVSLVQQALKAAGLEVTVSINPYTYIEW